MYINRTHGFPPNNSNGSKLTFIPEIIYITNGNISVTVVSLQRTVYFCNTTVSSSAEIGLTKEPQPLCLLTPQKRTFIIYSSFPCGSF